MAFSFLRRGKKPGPTSTTPPVVAAVSSRVATTGEAVEAKRPSSLEDDGRPVIGIWSEIPQDGRWSHEGISRIVGFMLEGAARLGLIKFVLVVRTGMAVTVREDLRQLPAVEHRDWEVVEKPADFEATFTGAQKEAMRTYRIEHDCALQAVFANQFLKIGGWVITFPQMTGAVLLDARRATMLPDAIPFDFPFGWNGEVHWGPTGEWVTWRQVASRALKSSDVIIAHSKHVAFRHGVGVLECDADHIRIVPHAPPDLAYLIPEAVNRHRSEKSLCSAANRMRNYAAMQGWRYLADFPFEEVPFMVISTQDRPTKNINRAAESLVSLLQRDFVDMKMFMTAGLHWGAEWTLLPGLVDSEGLHIDLMSMRDLPRDVHAALYHCAAVTVHPSYYEGIVGTLTFYETVSVGTPCVFASGPHVDELLEQHPELARSVFDPYDVDGLKRCLKDALTNRDEVLAIQQKACARMRERGWDMVALQYAEAAMGRELSTTSR